MVFTPFMQGSEAQSVISDYLGGKLNATPNVNSAGNFRNPFFDLRTEQEAAGTLDPSALYPNPQMDFSVQEDEIIDPCQEGFMLVDGICQPIEQFGQSMYKEKDDREDPEERPYMSIEDMKNANDYELLKYLDDGWLKGDKFNSTIGGNFMPTQFAIPFGKQNQMRRDFIIDELTRRGYSLGTQDKKGNEQFNVGNAFGLISNAEAANKIMTGDQQFIPEEINYQIQQKNERDRSSDNENYARTMTEQQVIEDAVKSGATSVNPFERFGINQSVPQNYTDTQIQGGAGKFNRGNPFI